MADSDTPTPAPDQAEVVEFSAGDDQAIQVRIAEDDVWLTAQGMADLFGQKLRNVQTHVRNIFDDGELEEDDYKRILPIEGRGRPQPIYPLDVIISVGYRVKSPEGIKFRQWATRTLKTKLQDEYRARHDEQRRLIGKLDNALQLAVDAIDTHDASPEQAKAIVSVIQQYARSFSLLLQYDEGRLPEPGQAGDVIELDSMVALTLPQARKAIATLKADLSEKGEATDLFGRERGDGLEGILGNIEQSFGGMALYPTIADRAANLLYFVIKDHPFTDGNKRIGSLLFAYYLSKNGMLLRNDGSPRFDDASLVAIALLIAESKPDDREQMIRLVMGLIGSHIETREKQAA